MSGAVALGAAKGQFFVQKRILRFAQDDKGANLGPLPAPCDALDTPPTAAPAKVHGPFDLR